MVCPPHLLLIQVREKKTTLIQIWFDSDSVLNWTSWYPAKIFRIILQISRYHDTTIPVVNVESHLISYRGVLKSYYTVGLSWWMYPVNEILYCVVVYPVGNKDDVIHYAVHDTCIHRVRLFWDRGVLTHWYRRWLRNGISRECKLNNAADHAVDVLCGTRSTVHTVCSTYLYWYPTGK